jgi:hypothetical protein
MTMLDTFNEIFDGDAPDYRFVTSHVALTGRDIEVEVERGEWVLTQREHNGDRVWTARHEDQTAAVLLLIAARMGMVGELRDADA